MKRKLLSILLVASMVTSLTACGSETGTGAATTSGNAAASSATDAAVVEENLNYSYGLQETFYSDEPVTYSMFFSDANWYPLVERWQTEGVFAKITERTNVTLDITSYDSGSYDEKIALNINAGESAYIIPKVYDESEFVDGGAVVPVSDYVQYMPNYQNFVETYNMQPDIDTITRADGKYYRLPGMLEQPLQDYTFILRKDLFDAAGVDVAGMEETWTYEDLYNALVDVKAYMVSEGMCSEDDYIWSDLWSGSESGQNSGGNLLKIIGAAYGVPSGWAVSDCITYDQEQGQWYLSSTTEEYKEFITIVNKFVEGGILDPETFTQDDTTATSKFYRGESVIMSVNRGQYATFLTGLDEGVGAGNYETYICVSPTGNNNFMAENTRLENGVMISTNALEELGEEDFIKMLRFVDWLWYSDEAYDLIKWGVEGETYEVVDGNKQLLDQWYCGGLGIAATDDTTQQDLRLELGYACGNFFYGHTVAQMTDNFSPQIQDYSNRVASYRDVRTINPALASTADENEMINLWKTPLIDNINTWTLQFITGQKDIETDWDAYVTSCENLNSVALVDLYNEINSR